MCLQRKFDNKVMTKDGHRILVPFKSHTRKPKVASESLSHAKDVIPDRCWWEFITYAELFAEGDCGIVEYQVDVESTGIGIMAGYGESGRETKSFWSALMGRSPAMRAGDSLLLASILLVKIIECVNVCPC